MSLFQTGIGVPQNRFREMAQSRAPSSQLPIRPSRTALESAVLHTCWRLGFRPTAEVRSPLDWRPRHLLQPGALSEEFFVEAWLLYGLLYGLLPNSTKAVSLGALGARLSVPQDK